MEGFKRKTLIYGFVFGLHDSLSSVSRKPDKATSDSHKRRGVQILVAATVLVAVIIGSSIGYFFGVSNQTQPGGNLTVLVITVSNTYSRTITLNNTATFLNGTSYVTLSVSTSYATETSLSTVTYTMTSNLTSIITTTTTTTNNATDPGKHHGH